MHTRIDESTLAHAAAWLAGRDAGLARIHAAYGVPPLWARAEGFGTLVHIILEQQVSIVSARAAFERLVARVGVLTPASFLELGDEDLRRMGFSRQKTAYGRHLARAIEEGRVVLAGLASQPDEAVRRALVAVKGIGPWTADIYLLMALGRPDVWPAGDLALAVAVQRLDGLAARPAPDALLARSEVWRPWRAVAARMLWQDYLGGAAAN